MCYLQIRLHQNHSIEFHHTETHLHLVHYCRRIHHHPYLYIDFHHLGKDLGCSQFDYLHMKRLHHLRNRLHHHQSHSTGWGHWEMHPRDNSTNHHHHRLDNQTCLGRIFHIHLHNHLIDYQEGCRQSHLHRYHTTEYYQKEKHLRNLHIRLRT